MVEIGNPAIILKATHTGRRAHSVDTKDGGNLAAELTISIGARIMLQENIWTERGLVNGAMGYIHDIIWPPGCTDPRSESPLALLAYFDSYKGPCVTQSLAGHPVVPIFRSVREYMVENALCTRTQFPLTIAYAITIHKSQGITVDRAVLNLGSSKDFAPGLTYVAVSRVKTLGGILFEEPFDYARLQSKDSATKRNRDRDTERRRTQHVGVVPAGIPCCQLTFTTAVSNRARHTSKRVISPHQTPDGPDLSLWI
jgi:ATP-dependent exoDNAse (exonuclease V) alpha subunit